MSYHIIFIEDKTPSKDIIQKDSSTKGISLSSISKLSDGFAIVETTNQYKGNIYVDGFNIPNDYLQFNFEDITRILRTISKSYSVDKSHSGIEFYIVTDGRVRTIPIRIPRTVRIENMHKRFNWDVNTDLILIPTTGMFNNLLRMDEYLSPLEVRYFKMERKFG